MRAVLIPLTCACLAVAGGGCALFRQPNPVNNALRRENLELRARIERLELDRQADAARIAGLEQRAGTLPTLPQERLRKLFTTHGLKAGRLTGGADLDATKPGDEALKVYVVPTDQSGQPIKAAGAFTVEAFDTSRPEGGRIGRWEFPVEQGADNWYGALGRYGYVLTCPWQTPPGGTDLHVDVTFRDELTGAPFKTTFDAKVQPPPASTSRPAPTTKAAPVSQRRAQRQRQRQRQ